MKNAHLTLFALAAAAFGGQNDSFLIRNAEVYPVSGPRIENASLLVVDGKIAEIGPKIQTKLKVRIIEGKGLRVYPGMIDSGTVVGLSEVGSVRETSDTGELGTFNPQLRPLIAVNPESEHIPVTRANGITTVALLPAAAGGFGGAGGGSMIGGQISLIHLNGWTWEEMAVVRSAAIHLRYPEIRSVSFNPDTMQVTRGNYATGKRQRDQFVQELNEFFEQARRYQTAKKANEPGLKADLKLEAMLPLLEGKQPLVVFAEREREIKEAIAFADRQQVKIILAGVRRPEGSIETIAKRRIPVILGTTLALPLEEDDPYDEQFALPGKLQKAGVKFAFASFGTQFARNLPYEAAAAAPFGLTPEEALRSVTLNAAEIWGIADSYGSIEKGKVADLIVTDGDPLEIPTQVRMMFIKGEQVDLESKHTRLYKKYLARP